MLFTSAIVSAILATSSLAVASPLQARTNPPPAATTPSLTSQLFTADTAADRFTLLPGNSNFVFNFGDPAKKGMGGAGGDLIAANRKAFPALVGSGSGMAVGFLGPCGFNTPHVHPRATELQIVTEGKIITEMLPENGVFNTPGDAKSGRRVIHTELGVDQMTVFYQGSVHTQFNPDCKPAKFVAAFNSEDFGAGQVAEELFAFESDIVQAAFGEAIDGAQVEKFKGKIPPTIAFGVEQCLKTCGINKTY